MSGGAAGREGCERWHQACAGRQGRALSRDRSERHWRTRSTGRRGCRAGSCRQSSPAARLLDARLSRKTRCAAGKRAFVQVLPPIGTVLLDRVHAAVKDAARASARPRLRAARAWCREPVHERDGGGTGDPAPPSPRDPRTADAAARELPILDGRGVVRLPKSGAGPLFEPIGQRHHRHLQPALRRADQHLGRRMADAPHPARLAGCSRERSRSPLAIGSDEFPRAPRSAPLDGRWPGLAPSVRPAFPPPVTPAPVRRPGADAGGHAMQGPRRSLASAFSGRVAGAVLATGAPWSLGRRLVPRGDNWSSGMSCSGARSLRAAGALPCGRGCRGSPSLPGPRPRR